MESYQRQIRLLMIFDKISGRPDVRQQSLCRYGAG
jgi:hypothetical protein